MKRLSNKLWLLLAAFLPLTLVMGCAGTGAAYKSSVGLGEKAKVIAEHYYAVIHQANLMKQQGVLTGSKLRQIQSMVESTRPVIRKMADAAKAYEDIKTSETEADLDAAMTEAAIAISNLIDAIKEIGSGVSLITQPEEDRYGPETCRAHCAA